MARAQSSFREHTVDQTVGRLFIKAEAQYAKGHYSTVFAIAMQYGWNMAANTVYYNLSKEESYDQWMERLVKTVLDETKSAADRAALCIEQLQLLSDSHKKLFAGKAYDPASIK